MYAGKSLIAFGLCILMVEQAMADDKKPGFSQSEEITIPAATGKKEMSLHKWRHQWKDAKGKSYDSGARALYDSGNAVAWIGTECDHYVCANSQIFGVKPVLLGLAFIPYTKKQIIRHDKKNKNELLPEDMEEIVATYEASGDEWASAKRVSLAEIVGLDDVLVPKDSTSPPINVEILDVNVETNKVVVTARSALGKTISLELSESLEPLAASVDGVQVYPKVPSP